MPSTHSKQPIDALADILQNIQLATDFTEGMSYETFRADVRTVYAVTRCLEIISEASRRLLEELKGRHPKIHWLAVAAAGNVYRHEYESVDEVQLWHTIQRELADLRQAVISELKK